MVSIKGELTVLKNQITLFFFFLWANLIINTVKQVHVHDENNSMKPCCFHGSYNLEKILNFSSCLEMSLNLVKVLEIYYLVYSRHNFL